MAEAEHAPAAPRRRPRIPLPVKAALSAALVVAIFYYLLRGIDLGEVWGQITAMTWFELATLAALALWNLATYAFVWMAVTPGLGFGRAMVMTQSTTAVTNTVPGGSAIGVGMTYSMLHSWGFSRSRTTLAVLVSGVWNSFIKLGMPVLALALVALQGDAGGSRVAAALVGIGALVAAVVIFALMLRSENVARRVGELAGAIASRGLRAIRRPPVHGWELATVKFRTRTLELLEHGWAMITITSLVSHVSLYLVLLLTLRHVGVSDAEVGWAEVLAVFAFARLATALPITPGGAGVVEAVLIAGLTAAGGDRPDVVAAVLVYRALTWGLPIIVGIGTYLWSRGRVALHPHAEPAAVAPEREAPEAAAPAGDPAAADPRTAEAAEAPAPPIRRSLTDLAWLAAGAGLLILTALAVRPDRISTLETSAFRLVNDVPSLPFAIVWLPMQLGNFLVVPAAVLAAVLLRRWRLAAGMAIAGGAAYALAKVVKHYVPRGRPSALLDGVVIRGSEASGIGYVSGHIATLTALVLVAWPWLPRWGRWAAAAGAVSVFLSRMYVGAHLPLDMVGGAALGLAVGACARILLGIPASAEARPVVPAPADAAPAADVGVP